MSREPLPDPESLTHVENDQNLILRTLAGDREAFDVLVTRYRDRIYGLALHMLWNEQEAEDVAQEVFVRAYRSLGRFRGDSQFFTWLYRIAVNLVYTQAQKNSRWRRLQAPVEQAELLEQPAGLSPADRVESREAADMLHAAIRELDPRLRQVLVLRDLEGLDVAETARLLGLPSGTIKSRLSRAHDRLREILRARGNFRTGEAVHEL